MIKTALNDELKLHLTEVKNCKLCPNMIGPVVTHGPVVSKIYLVGQAPGPKEGQLGKPFAWTAGKTLFRWFGSLGVDEETFRARAFIAAVCRCFPGKTKQGGDRVPSKEEVENCSQWIEREMKLMTPSLVIPVGRLAIAQFLPDHEQLTDVIGEQFTMSKYGCQFDLIALPHPSGASTWFKREPGKTLLQKALTLLGQHAEWKKTFAGEPGTNGATTAGR